MTQAPVFTHQATQFEDLAYNDRGIFLVPKGDIYLRFFRIDPGETYAVFTSHHIIMTLSGEVVMDTGGVVPARHMMAYQGNIAFTASVPSMVCVASGVGLKSLNLAPDLLLQPIDMLALPFEAKTGVVEKKYFTWQLGNQVFKWILFSAGHEIKKHIHTDLGMLKLQWSGKIQYDHEQFTGPQEFLTFTPGIEHYEGKILEDTVLLTIENAGGKLVELT